MTYLLLSNLSKFYGNTLAVENFNLEVERGEFVSFLGPSGCGKTTTLRMVAGFEVPDQGQIVLEGEDITQLPPNQRMVGMVFQSYALFPNMNVADNVGFGLSVRKMPAEQIRQRVSEILKIVQLEDLQKRYPYQLSGGQQQRVALARALAIRPRVLLLDEPLSALDAKIRVELRAEIRRIQQELKITTIYVTHDQEEALSLSDRIVVMNKGKIEQIGTPFEIYNYPQTEFVASFIGQLNLIPVQVVDREGGLYRIGTHTIQVEQNHRTPLSSQPKLAIRPEEVKLGSVEGWNQLTALVRQISFLGAIVRIWLDVEGVSLLLDVFNERKLELPKVNEKVVISFPHHACWVL
ncbi:spermidine/putrescine ABC transporter ATP-binding subunit [Bellilinea caldifistulae]|uniref:Spermidine/putrescine import ATP-binding protein PotA n=1 Tax=Bellilinea caldifistulae TaxID=360411 RepID=A0A0P6X8W5_9CHLR|nr:ABC transporter ATP-binding protein [Bellilinea caldifistulae]KPL75984.1 spermidine/putrescine ABC transporter ATP-binding protein [Bellilinea caldifistulae]GAP11470.1 spermidine/putrescine ABC transporter ATP-binding subunit [Bellilinea caldifistulae]